MNKTIIIAEAGINHNGDINIAKKLIEEASKAGADIVKFQTFKADLIATSKAKKANYQKINTDPKINQKEMLHKLQLKDEDFFELYDHCKKYNIEFLSTPFDFESLELLLKIGIKRIKVPSGEITNLPFLRIIGSKNLPIILSTGMANLGDIESAINELSKVSCSRDDIIVLHCTSEYPAPLNEANLNAMKTIKGAFNIQIGYSDHTLGIEVSLAAVALGAKVVEKHITLDVNSYGPDHKSSLEPKEFRRMVDGIRKVEKALGNGIKKPTRNEVANSLLVRKSIVASKKINKGDLFSTDNLTCKRPFNGLSPMYWDKIIGRKSEKDYNVDDPIS